MYIFVLRRVIRGSQRGNLSAKNSHKSRDKINNSWENLVSKPVPHKSFNSKIYIKHCLITIYKLIQILSI